MNLPDLNVLLYAVNRSSTRHVQAKAWLESAFSSNEGVGLAWIALLGFLRLSTRKGIFPTPLSIEQALGIIRSWTSAARVRILNPTERHLAVLSSLLIGAGTAGNLTTDAHLAALAIEHGATLTTYDGDFDRFAGLTWELLE